MEAVSAEIRHCCAGYGDCAGLLYSQDMYAEGVRKDIAVGGSLLPPQ